MEWDSVMSVARSWRRFPPPAVALRRLERLYLSAHGVETDDGEKPAPASFSDPSTLPTEADAMGWANAINGR